jgi:hypothetical protein
MKIYGYRSAVVHGRGNAGKSESVTLLGSQTSSVDGELLRELLRARLEEPTLTNDEITIASSPRHWTRGRLVRPIPTAMRRTESNQTRWRNDFHRTCIRFRSSPERVGPRKPVPDTRGGAALRIPARGESKGISTSRRD